MVYYRKITAGFILLSSAALIKGFWFPLNVEKNVTFFNESNLTIKSLRKALVYLQKQPEILTSDVILGVLIAKANLQWIFNKFKDHSRANSWIERELKSLLRQCNDIIEFSEYKNLLILKDNLWEDAAGDLKLGDLNINNNEFFLPKFDSCESVDFYMMKGTPEDSDLCINELLESHCEVSENCWLSEINGGFHSGYKTSHRLLYFQVAFQMKCEDINPKKFSGITAIKKKLCLQMLQEATTLFKKPNFFYFQDLFMEQIALCGLEGYEEFAPDNWRYQVRSWQNYKGCFGQGMNFKNCSTNPIKTNYKNIIKRTDFVIDDCHTHVTAVAISAIAFFLRVTLKITFNIP